MSSNMRFSVKPSAQLVLVWLGLANAFASFPSGIDPSHFAKSDQITRDVCVIGGGAGGTYAAIRLRELGKSVVVVEKESHFGGHTNTYKDPATGVTVDYGVLVVENITVVTNFFAHFNIPLITPLSGQGNPLTVDFRTGKPVIDNTSANETAAAFARYVAQLANYPYLSEGFNLPDPVPADLLLSFGDFAQKYDLGAAVTTIAALCQGVGDFLRQPTLYIMKYYNSQVVASSLSGFLATADHNNGALYDAAQNELGGDALVSSTIIRMERDCDKGVNYVVIRTPSGTKLISAAKVLIAVPPKLDNLEGFDLDDRERMLFGQFQNTCYYTALLSHTGIPDGLSINNRGTDTPYRLPALPGPYGILPTAISGVSNMFYGNIDPMDVEQVKLDMIVNILRLRNANISTTEPDFVAFSAHCPFELTVPVGAIADGFYRKLNALQGYRKTYYTGATFHTHDSSQVWNFTETVLQKIME